ncbi:hypothetical protein J6590_029294 [Homalodisca vitripennis]|nr:hypothetical protein J6590_029294 [Homalodisca vitripennis]
MDEQERSSTGVRIPLLHDGWKTKFIVASLGDQTKKKKMPKKTGVVVQENLKARCDDEKYISGRRIVTVVNRQGTVERSGKSANIDHKPEQLVKPEHKQYLALLQATCSSARLFASDTHLRESFTIRKSAANIDHKLEQLVKPEHKQYLALLQDTCGLARLLRSDTHPRERFIIRKSAANIDHKPEQLVKPELKQYLALLTQTDTCGLARLLRSDTHPRERFIIRKSAANIDHKPEQLVKPEHKQYLALLQDTCGSARLLAFDTHLLF